MGLRVCSRKARREGGAKDESKGRNMELIKLLFSIEDDRVKDLLVSALLGVRSVGEVN